MDTDIKTTPTIRPPRLADGAQIWELVRRCKPLDLNSSYVYLLLCQHFADTCLVAEAGGKIVGFVSAYKPPSTSDVIFVWQIAIDPSMRGHGLAKTLLNNLLKMEACRGIRFLEATISPSNEPSRGLFRSFAKGRGVACEETPLFLEEHFPDDEQHEAEALFRIGPFQAE